jgi:hypothetical protein
VGRSDLSLYIVSHQSIRIVSMFYRF